MCREHLQAKQPYNVLALSAAEEAGLQPGDQWCLCAARFLQAADEGCAPNVSLEATHQRALEVVSLEVLRSNSS